MPNDSPNKDHSKNGSSNTADAENIRQKSSSQNTRMRTLLAQIRERMLPLTYRPGVHTRNYLLGAGFTYTGDGDTARCDNCGLEVSHWTTDMVPFTIHSTQRPDCPFVRSITPSSSLITVVRNTPVSNEQQNTPEHQSIESVDSNSSLNSFTESDLLQQARRRTFSHWPHHSIPSSAEMIEAGFFSCNIRDRVICVYCNFICQQWTSHTDDPCEVHRTLSPNCIYARAFLARRGPLFIVNEDQKLMRFTADRPSFASNNINPVQISEHVRPVVQNNNRGTIQNDLSSPSISSSSKSPSVDDSIQANYFNTDSKTVVTCFCCNGLLRNLGSNENPMIDHARRFPNCPYVKGKLIRPPASSVIILNESSTTVVTNNHLSTSNNHDPLRSNEIVFPVACNPTYAELPKRRATFATWPNENLPSVDDLVRAGFFYTRRQTIVTCFYCNGSLQKWGPEDNPMIRHARWFPHCAYAKQLCGPERYRKIRERAQEERVRANEAREKASDGIMLNTNPPTDGVKLSISQGSSLSELAAARLDLPISQSLLDQNFKRSIIRQCWEDQLRLKQADFVSECDLYVACLIRQKQIEHIDGKKENIVVPSIKMKQIREKSEARIREQTTNFARSTSNTTDVEMTTKTILTARGQDQSINSAPSNSCVVCLIEERRLAFIPCGHLATCVPCEHSLQSCPTCRRKIEAFIRIYTSK